MDAFVTEEDTRAHCLFFHAGNQEQKSVFPGESSPSNHSLFVASEGRVGATNTASRIAGGRNKQPSGFQALIEDDGLHAPTPSGSEYHPHGQVPTGSLASPRVPTLTFLTMERLEASMKVTRTYSSLPRTQNAPG